MTYSEALKKGYKPLAKPILFNGEMVRAILDGRKTQTRRIVKTRHKNAAGFNVMSNRSGKIVGIIEYDEDERDYDNYMKPPFRSGDILYVRETWGIWSPTYGTMPRIYYRADNDAPEETEWRPSIHMPKELARIFLRIKDAHVERLLDMSADDALAEGIIQDGLVTEQGIIEYRVWNEMRELWDSTIKPADRERYGWDANPWVWVIEFERINESEANYEN